MNWQAISFDWNQVRAVLATAEEGSFSGAARALRTTQPTIGRQVSSLEQSLGITLFERTVRGPVLTEAGQDLIDHVRGMGDAATLISLVASGQSQDVTGEVSLAASDLMASAILPPLLLELQTLAPGVRVRIVASGDLSDLTRRDADIAIRHVRPTQPELIARHIGDFRANHYASRSYLDAAGRPRTVRDLADLRFVGSSDLARHVAILQERGIPAYPENFVAITNSGPAMWEYVKGGLGIALLPEVLGEAEPEVEKVLPNLPSLEFPVWLVTHRELKTSPRIRVVFDALARGLRQIAQNAIENRSGD